jgi:hypothetical protein
MKMRRLRLVIVLSTVFLASLLAAFLAVYLIPSPLFHDRLYSIPESHWGSELIEGIGNHIGPPLNATDVPLDTVVFLSLMRTSKSEVLQLFMSPEVVVLRQVFEFSFPASGAFIWYFAEPLKPATTYNATIIWHDIPVTWNFTTTDKPFSPRYEAFPNQFGQQIAVLAAVSTTIVAGLLIYFKIRKHQAA